MKKYLGKNPLNTLMGIMLDVIPSKELSEDTDIQRMWDKLNIKPAPIGSESNWDYTLDNVNNTITLKKYIGSETDVIVYGRYQINGKEYDTKIGYYANTLYGGLFNSYNSNCANIKTITFNEGIDTSKCADMNNMFRDCRSLTHINGLEYFDTSKVSSMSYMFYNCSSLTELDLRLFDTHNVGIMTAMFYGCSALNEIKVTSGKWVTSSNNTNMFKKCRISSVTYYPAA